MLYKSPMVNTSGRLEGATNIFGVFTTRSICLNSRRRYQCQRKSMCLPPAFVAFKRNVISILHENCLLAIWMSFRVCSYLSSVQPSTLLAFILEQSLGVKRMVKRVTHQPYCQYFHKSFCSRAGPTIREEQCINAF